MPNNNKRFGMSRLLIFLLLLIAVIAAGCLKQQDISDYIKLYGYGPSAEVEQLAADTTMTPRGRKLFYVNRPVLAGRESFNQYCSSYGENSIVLGCYHAVDQGIYVFRISDGRLKGVEQVTAAHEMLHAAYDRLSAKDRQHINSLLEDYYQHSVTDQRIKDTIAAYQKSEPNDVVNEMHSIFGTEISALPPELESYYQAYFTNRATVVGYANNYQQEFTSRRDQVKAYDDQLSGLKAQIDFNTKSLADQQTEIITMQSNMEADKADGNIAAYNAQVPVYNGRINRYNDLVVETKALITQYNQIVGERNAIASEVKQLAQSINSHLAPIDQ